MHSDLNRAPGSINDGHFSTLTPTARADGAGLEPSVGPWLQSRSADAGAFPEGQDERAAASHGTPTASAPNAEEEGDAPARSPAPVVPPPAPREAQWIRPGQIQQAYTVSKGPFAGHTVINNPGSLLETSLTAARGQYRPSAIVDVVHVGSVQVGAVSLRGSMHYDGETVRQDSFSIDTTEDGGWLIVAVADGVSEGKRSHIGADTACASAISAAKAELAAHGITDTNWARVSENVRSAVRRRAEVVLRGNLRDADGNPAAAEDVPDTVLARHVGTTAELLVIETTPTEVGYRCTQVKIAGDGSALIADPAKGWWPLAVGKAKTGELASNAVIALPQNPGEPVVFTGYLQPGQAILVTTDGIGDHLGDGSTAVGGYLHEEWCHPRSSVDLLRTASFITFQCDDDRTAVVVWAK